ncbi:MAG: hypothetical protein COW79_07680, partial [Bdellovibrionales bacterium CG22_combo_CG10-13_8_21_14_all_38_13]
MKNMYITAVLNGLKFLANLIYKVLIIIISHIVLLYIGFSLGMNTCHAKTIYYGSETEAVTISYGGETIFRFNEPVKTISR